MYQSFVPHYRLLIVRSVNADIITRMLNKDSRRILTHFIRKIIIRDWKWKKQNNKRWTNSFVSSVALKCVLLKAHHRYSIIFFPVFNVWRTWTNQWKREEGLNLKLKITRRKKKNAFIIATILDSMHKINKMASFRIIVFRITNVTNKGSKQH